MSRSLGYLLYRMVILLLIFWALSSFAWYAGGIMSSSKIAGAAAAPEE